MPEAIRRTSSDYAQGFADLLPQGAAWPRDPNSVLQTVIFGLSGIWGAPPEGASPPPTTVSETSVDGRAADLLGIESDPSQTLELLPDWERAFGLPDLCLNETLSIADRQAALVARIATLGGQSRQWFIDYATAIGYTITIQEHSPYMTGLSQVGLTVGLTSDNPDTPRWELGAPTIRYYWNVVISNVRLTWFRTGGGGGQCGIDPLLRISFATDLECAIRRYSPGHTQVIFSYVGSVSIVTLSYLQSLYPTSGVTQNGSVVMVTSGFPTTVPSESGMPWSNGGVLQVSDLLTSAVSPGWISSLLLAPGTSGQIWINGLVLMVS